jgi:hypothetical protein
MPGLGIGLSADFTGGDGGGGGFVPTQLANLVLWLKADGSYTIAMGAIVATGTAPPAVTLSGTPADVLPIEIDISTTGVRGIAKFQWKLGGVVQQVGQITQATFVLGTTGLTANFPVGAYVNDNVYTSAAQVSTWTDLSGAGNSVTQATQALQPVYSIAGGPNGLPALTGDAARVMSTANSLLSGQPSTVFLVIQSNNAGANYTFFDMEGNGAYSVAINTTANSRNVRISNPATACADQVSGPTTSWEAWTIEQTTAPLTTLRVNGAAHTLNNNNVNVAANSSGTTIMANSSSNTKLNGAIQEIIVYDTALTGAQVNQVEAYIRARTAIW